LGMKSKRVPRSLLATAIILALALVGLLAVNTDRVGADSHTAGQELGRDAEGENTTQQSNQTLFTSAFPSLVRMISALAIVLVCIYLAMYLLKRMMGKRYSTSGQPNLLEVLATIYIAPKKTVSLVRVADKSVLVGMTDNQISVLTELDAYQTALIEAAQKGQKEKDHFSELLKSASHRIKRMGVKKSQVALDSKSPLPS